MKSQQRYSQTENLKKYLKLSRDEADLRTESVEATPLYKLLSCTPCTKGQRTSACSTKKKMQVVKVAQSNES